MTPLASHHTRADRGLFVHTGFEVTDRRRALQVAGVGFAALLVLVLAVVMLFVRPVLDRVDQTLLTLNSALPVLNDLGPDVDAVRSDVSEVTPDVEALRGSLGDLSGGIDDINGSLGRLEALDTLVGELERTTAGIDTISARLAEVTDALERVLVLLEETEQHVENIDEKSGPAPPEAAPGGG